MMEPGFWRAEDLLNMDFDFVRSKVCIIGSGAGGGAVAAELSNYTDGILIIEEGGYYRTQDFISNPVEMMPKLYRMDETVIFGNAPIMLAEGRCVGGSTVVNAGVCWRIPDFVQDRWTEELKLDYLNNKKMNELYDIVEKRLPVLPQDEDSAGLDNILLKEGAERLGYSAVRVSRNQTGGICVNNCIFGCPTGVKRSSLVSFLPYAVKRGAIIFSDTRAKNLIYKNDKIEYLIAEIRDKKTKRKKTIVIKADAFVIGCGAIQTPYLLLKSGIRQTNIGKNLYIHPNVKAIGIYENEVRGWEGPVQVWQIHHFIREGIIMATTFVPPGFFAMSVPFIANKCIDIMKEISRMVMAGVLVEDDHSGFVRTTPFGIPFAYYRITERDMKMFLKGLSHLSEIYFASGAKKVLLPFPQMPFASSMDDIKRLSDIKLRPHDFEVFTVHIMGTCRIGRDESTGATDQRGRLFGMKNLYIADASLIPTPIGVNPQLTIMALATNTAHSIIEDLKKSPLS